MARQLEYRVEQQSSPFGKSYLEKKWQTDGWELVTFVVRERKNVQPSTEYQYIYKRWADTVTKSWGVQRIARERHRQIIQEGFDQDHDNTEEGAGQMALAAACYAASAAGVHSVFEEGDPRNGPKELWPWSEDWDKREKHSKIRQLEIAGALMAAELDRLHAEGE